MASLEAAMRAELVLPYRFRDLSLLQKALTAGDTNSDDREGHRGLAQVGDAMMNFVIKSEGLARGVPRAELEKLRSGLTSKKMCDILARALHLDECVKASERQIHDGPQPTTMKNTLSAVLAVVWQDSRHDYDAVIRVMTSLGLINCAEPMASMQESALGDHVSLPSAIDDTFDWLAESDVRMTDTQLYEFLDIDMSGQLWTSPKSSHLQTDWHDVGTPPETALENVSVQPQIISGTDNILLDHHSASNKPMALGDRPTQRADSQSPISRHPASLTSHNTTNTNHVFVGESQVATQIPVSKKTPAYQDITPIKRNRIEKRVPPTKGHQINVAFRNYVQREEKALAHKPEAFTQYYSHMQSYEEALSAIKTLNPRQLATIALAIGDCSAISILKAALASVRSPIDSKQFRVVQGIDRRERLETISRLDMLAADIRIVRWLHIYYLYKESADEIGGKAGGKDVDGFVVFTSANLSQASTAPRGNPLCRQQKETSQLMMDDAGADSLDPTEKKRRYAYMRKMRRIGARLLMMVKRWGIGVLSLLGAGLTDDILLGPTDVTFAEFLDVVHRFEGPRICAVSSAAVSAIQLFMNGNTDQPKLKIEVTEENALPKLPRLSEEMEAFLKCAIGN